MEILLERDFTISPTFAVKEATRDVMAAARREWHDTYTMPWQWRFYTISRKSHGSFFFDWTSEDEAAGAEDYRLGMAFVNEFKNRGGRVTAGSDAGYVWCLYGFCYVRELELLQERASTPWKCCARRRCTAPRRSASMGKPAASRSARRRTW